MALIPKPAQRRQRERAIRLLQVWPVAGFSMGFEPPVRERDHSVPRKRFEHAAPIAPPAASDDGGGTRAR